MAEASKTIEGASSGIGKVTYLAHGVRCIKDGEVVIELTRRGTVRFTVNGYSTHTSPDEARAMFKYLLRSHFPPPQGDQDG